MVPFLRFYRTRDDIPTWFNDPTIFELIQSEYQRGYYRGLGEFHIYGKAASAPLVKKIVDFAVERDLYLHAHCDDEALLILFGHNRRPRSSGRTPASTRRRRESPSCSRLIRRCGANYRIAAASPKAAASFPRTGGNSSPPTPTAS